MEKVGGKLRIEYWIRLASFNNYCHKSSHGLLPDDLTV